MIPEMIVIEVNQLKNHPVLGPDYWEGVHPTAQNRQLGLVHHVLCRKGWSLVDGDTIELHI